jgi:two-component system, response regulator PdtaR
MSETPRVLIVEDDVMIALWLTQLLEELGYQVCAIAVSQAEAIDLAHQHRPNLMIVDVQLRRGTGTAAVQEIQRTASIPHVFLSGAPDDVRACWPDSVVVAKPFRQATLKAAITRALAPAYVF